MSEEAFFQSICDITEEYEKYNNRYVLADKYKTIYGIIGEFAMINNYLSNVVKHKKRNDALAAFKDKIEAGEYQDKIGEINKEDKAG